MSKLRTKAKVVSTLLFTLLSAIAVAVPLSHITLMLIALSAVLSAISYFLAVMKNKKWSMFAWIWSAFCLPYVLTQVLLFDYLTHHVTVESLITWGPAIYLAILPIAIAIMSKHLKLVVAELYQSRF